MFKLINLCRLCRSYENIITTLHHIDSDNLSFFQKLNSIASGILESNANLPDGICSNCITEMNIAYKFINKCSESQAIFQRYLEQLQNGQQAQPANNREILIKVIKLEESYWNSEVNLNNSVTVKDEKESGFLNEETEKYNVHDNANDNSESDKANFQNDIEVEEEIRNILANLKKEIIEQICNDSADDIQTNEKGNEIKLEHNYSLRTFEELEHLYDENASESTTTRDHSNSINIKNEYEFTEVKDIKTDEDDFENDNVVDLPKNSEHFIGFNLVECDVANDKVKYDLKLERLGKVINNEHMKSVDKVLDRSEIGENSLNVNIIQAPNKYKTCDKASNRRSNLTRHKRTRSGKKLDKPYQCALCGRAAASKSALQQHMRIHTKEKPFKCETCKNAFTQSSALKQHIRIHTNEKPYKCKTCDRAFNRSYNLKQHIRIHANEKRFKCEICNKAFNLSSHLKQHIRIHANKKLLKCEICNQIFKKSSALKQHILNHTNEKPYKCETCNKTFKCSSYLKQHMLIHASEKPFKCETCNKTFTQNGNLKQHIRCHSNERPFKCETCNKAFRYSSNLKEHVRSHTNNTTIVYVYMK